MMCVLVGDISMTQAGSKLTSPELPADSQPLNEVEITGPMIEAGVDAICQFFGWELDDSEKIVCSVYLAMIRASAAAREVPSD
jgi:hypothetical protein